MEKGLPREQASKIKKEHLYQTAVRLFQKNGYESTTIAQISKASGMAIGSIYHFYTGKFDFLCRLGHELFKEAWAILEDDKPIPADATETLLAYYQCIARQMDRVGRPLCRSLFDNYPKIWLNDEGAPNEFSSFSRVTPFLRRAQAAGALATDLPAEEMSVYLHIAMLGPICSWAFRRQRTSMMELVEWFLPRVLDPFRKR